MKNSMKVAFCGVMAALSLVVMLLAGVVPVATVALPAVAGCLLIPVVVEAGLAWGFGVYGVCSVLAFLLVPDREAFLFYALFFGYYPVLYAPALSLHVRRVNQEFRTPPGKLIHGFKIQQNLREFLPAVCDNIKFPVSFTAAQVQHQTLFPYFFSESLQMLILYSAVRKNV